MGLAAPVPFSAPHFDISDSDDTVSMVLLMAADGYAAALLLLCYMLPIGILAAVGGWILHVESCEDNPAAAYCFELFGNQFDKQTEWTVVYLVFCALGAPVLTGFHDDMTDMHNIWCFSRGVVGPVKMRIRLAVAIKMIDVLQPLLALCLSGVIALTLAQGEFLNVFLNILVLEFVVTVDTPIIYRILQMDRFTDKHLSVALYLRAQRTCSEEPDGGQARLTERLKSFSPAEWTLFRDLGEDEIKSRLRDFQSPNALKWSLLSSCTRGIGIGCELKHNNSIYKAGDIASADVQLSLVDWESDYTDDDAIRWLAGMSYEAYRERLSRAQRQALPQILLLPVLMDCLRTSHEGVELVLSEAVSFKKIVNSGGSGIAECDLRYLGYDASLAAKSSMAKEAATVPDGVATDQAGGSNVVASFDIDQVRMLASVKLVRWSCISQPQDVCLQHVSVVLLRVCGIIC